MGSTRRVRWWLPLLGAVGLGVAGLVPSAHLLADTACPNGQDRWQCVHDCPAGTLYDGASDSCVAAPGVPPPPLPQPIPQAPPQIPQI